MTTVEFSNEFDTLLSSYSTQASFGEQSSRADVVLDEYEKSVLLTTAQEDIVQGLYNGTYSDESFERTERLRRSLDSLTKTAYPEKIDDKQGLSKYSTFYKLDDDVWYITYESVDLEEGCLCKDKATVKVIPMRQDEWHNISENPFRRPNRRRVIRLDNGSNVSELISEYPIKNYLVRYLSKPTPIVLVDLEDISIDGVSTKTDCKLNTVLHRPILERAVRLAAKRVAQLASK